MRFKYNIILLTCLIIFTSCNNNQGRKANRRNFDPIDYYIENQQTNKYCMDSNQYLVNINLDTLLICSLVKNSPKVFVFFSENLCQPCVNAMLTTINTNTSEKLRNDIIFVGDMTNSKNLKIYMQNYKLELNNCYLGKKPDYFKDYQALVLVIDQQFRSNMPLDPINNPYFIEYLNQISIKYFN